VGGISFAGMLLQFSIDADIPFFSKNYFFRLVSALKNSSLFIRNFSSACFRLNFEKYFSACFRFKNSPLFKPDFEKLEKWSFFGKIPLKVKEHFLKRSDNIFLIRFKISN
jgi:hypothetical protein